MSAMLRFLARPLLFFYALPWLMVLLVLGTVSQRSLGLYQAEQLYFSSFILWAGPLPLPGTPAILLLIAANLTARLLLQQGWFGPKLGTSLTHVSILILLLGGAVTSLTREDGFMELAPAATGHLVTDYHRRVLAIARNGDPLREIDTTALRPGAAIAGLPFTLTVTAACRHCATAPVAQPTPDLRDAARRFRLVPAKPLPQDEDNQTGIAFTLRGTAADGAYIAYAPMLHMPEVAVGHDRYRFTLRRAERSLPFALRLDRFEKTEHPGTAIPSAYRSNVTVIDGNASWPAEIAMNAPLRYRGYTIYQSAFIDRPDGAAASILAVVHDKGQIFPYLAVATLCLGMALHLVMLLRRRSAA